MTVFVRQPVAFSQMVQLVDIFKFMPQAQFSANHPNYFLLTTLTLKVLGGIIIGPVGAMRLRTEGEGGVICPPSRSE